LTAWKWTRLSVHGLASEVLISSVTVPSRKGGGRMKL
jgi:hypothetical protein